MGIAGADRSARPTSAQGGRHGYAVVSPLLILLLPLLGAAQRRVVQSDGVPVLSRPTPAHPPSDRPDFPPRRLSTGTPCNSTSAGLSAAQCSAWQAGFDALSGAAWTKCHEDARQDPCSTTCVKCEGADITEVNFNSIPGMSGALPEGWAAFSNLRKLDFVHQPLVSGTLPSAWSALSKLEYFRIFNSPLVAGQLLGDFWSNMTVVRYFELGNCKVSGTLPASLPASLETLKLTTKLMTGTLPAQWSSLASLKGVHISGNPGIKGELPRDLSTWQALEILEANGCDFSGALPATLPPMIKRFHVKKSRLSGLIPDAWSGASRMEKLELEGNVGVGGKFPDWVRMWPLLDLRAAGCTFTGLPAALPATLATLIMSRNLLSGTIPEMPRFIKEVQLQENKLTGSLPQEWSGRDKVYKLYFHTNPGLGGSLPSQWSSLPLLRDVKAYGCSFSGTLPKEWGLGFGRLENLDLNGNSITGDIPREWQAGFEQLRWLRLQDNRLSGEVPAEVVPLLSRVDACELQRNRFRCPLPAGMPSCKGASCCQNGTFNLPWREATWEVCNDCPNATFFASTEGANCNVCPCSFEPCPQGTFGAFENSTNAHICIGCSQGQFQDEVGAEGSNSCKSCKAATNNALTDSRPNATSLADCVTVYRPECAAGASGATSESGACELCPSGRFKADSGVGTCESCPCGQWQNRPGQLACDAACAAGTFGNASSGQCDACPPSGFFCTASLLRPMSEALQCVPGQFEQHPPNVTADRVCGTCAPGSFSSASNRAACSSCGVGEFQPGTGLGFCFKQTVCFAGEHTITAATATTDRRCAECAAGSFSNASNLAACFACGADEFQPGIGRGFCNQHTKCTAGEHLVAAPNATADRRCAECAAGSFSNASNLAACFACGADEFQPAVGRSFCNKHTVCAAGEFLSAAPTVTADRKCSGCAAGQFGASANSAACESCPLGKFQTGGAQVSCIACAAGKKGSNVSSVARAQHCVGCEAGQHQSRDGQTHCVPCPAGFFSPESAPSCIPCAAGRFQSATGQSNCASCEACVSGSNRKACGGASPGYCGICSPGTFVGSTGACMRCAAGSFSPVENADSCEPCAEDSFQPSSGKSFCNQHTKCTAGQHEAAAPNATADRRCAECAAGSFSNASNLAACFACGADENQPEGGRAFCNKHTVCVAGEFQAEAPSATSDRVCRACLDGQFSKHSNSASCTSCGPCPNGLRQSCGGAFGGFCAACSAGTFFTAGSCESCRAGYWCQDGKEFPCGSASSFCPPKSATPSAVADGHYSVPANASEGLREGQTACEEGFTCTRGVKASCPAGRVCQLTRTARVIAGNASAAAAEIRMVKVTTQERCKDDEFVFDGKCFECPNIGVECKNGLLQLLPEYWYNPAFGQVPVFWGRRHLGQITKDANIYRCAPGSCLVSNTTGMPECAKGRRGTLCAVCDTGFYNTNNLECKACPKGESVVKYCGAMLFVLVAGFAGIRAWQKLVALHPRLSASIAERLPEVMKLLTGLYQILDAYTSVLRSVPWPDAFTAVTKFFSVVNLDIFGLPQARCSDIASSYYARFNVHLASMLALTGLFLLLLLYAYSDHNARRQEGGGKLLSRAFVWHMFLPFLFLIYPSISKTVILMLRCRDVDGRSYVLSDISLSCESAEYARNRRLAIFGVLVFPVGIVAFFVTVVGWNRKKIPPDWFPARTKEQCKEEYREYRAGSGMPKKFAAWKVEAWDPRIVGYDKFHKRFGFLYAAYKCKFWWFESLITLYKLAMTTGVLFVSDVDQLKILFGMMGCTLMMGLFAFFQPFKHPDILSINTGAQLVVLLVLFSAQYMLVNRGSGILMAISLVLLTIGPLVAGVVLVTRLPSEAIVAGVDDLMVNAAMNKANGARGEKHARNKSGMRKHGSGTGLSLMGSFRKRSSAKGKKRNSSDASDDSMAGGSEDETHFHSNPMHKSKPSLGGVQGSFREFNAALPPPQEPRRRTVVPPPRVANISVVPVQAAQRGSSPGVVAQDAAQALPQPEEEETEI